MFLRLACVCAVIGLICGQLDGWDEFNVETTTADQTTGQDPTSGWQLPGEEELPTIETGDFRNEPPNSEVQDCVTGCLRDVKIASGPLVSPKGLCLAYDNFQSCLRNCQNGDQIWEMTESALPQTVQQARNLCENVDYEEFDNFNMTDPGQECTDECESFLNLDMGSLERLCSSWDEYTFCLSNCPDGEWLIQQARQLVPDAFNIIDNFCHAGSSSDLAEFDSDWAIDYAVEPSDYDSVQAECAGDCVNTLMQSLNLKTQEIICNSYSNYEICIRTCPNGDMLWETAASEMSSTIAYIEDFCQDPTYANISLTSESSASMACLEDCRNVINYSGPLSSICSSYNNYVSCVASCEDGERILAMAEEHFSDATGYIERQCSTVNTPDYVAIGDYDFGAEYGSGGLGPYDPVQNAMPCVDRCIQDLMSYVGFKDISVMCDAFARYQPCIESCPSGVEIYSMAESMFPEGFDNFKSICTGNVTSLAIMSEYGATADCVSQKGCEKHLKFDGLQNTCQSFKDFQQCILECPEGLTALRKAQQMMPDSFGTIEDVCGQTNAGTIMIEDSTEKSAQRTVDEDIEGPPEIEESFLIPKKRKEELPVASRLAAKDEPSSSHRQQVPWLLLSILSFLAIRH